MCGICGVIKLDKRKNMSFEEQLNAMMLLDSIQSRGTDAWGFYAEKTKGNPQLFCSDKDNTIKGHLYKLPESFGDFISNGGMVNLQNTHTFLAHTRASTHGDESNNQNNHPFSTKDFIIAHNGTISNYSELIKEHKLKTGNIECDSYVIVALIQKHYDKNKDVVKAIEETSKELRGGFACWLYHKTTGDLYLFRRLNPINIYTDIENDCIVFASEERHITRSYLPTEIKTEDIVELEEYKIFKLEHKKLNEVGTLTTSAVSNTTDTYYNSSYSASSSLPQSIKNIEPDLSFLFQVFEGWDNGIDPCTTICTTVSEAVVLVEPEELINLLDSSDFHKYKLAAKTIDGMTQYEFRTLYDFQSSIDSLKRILIPETNTTINADELLKETNARDKLFGELATFVQCKYEFDKVAKKMIFTRQGKMKQHHLSLLERNGCEFSTNSRQFKMKLCDSNIEKLLRVCKELGLYSGGDLNN